MIECWFLKHKQRKVFLVFLTIWSITNNANNFLFTSSGQSRWVAIWIVDLLSGSSHRGVFIWPLSHLACSGGFYFTPTDNSEQPVWCFWTVGGSWSTDTVTGRTCTVHTGKVRRPSFVVWDGGANTVQSQIFMKHQISETVALKCTELPGVLGQTGWNTRGYFLMSPWLPVRGFHHCSCWHTTGWVQSIRGLCAGRQLFQLQLLFEVKITSCQWGGHAFR